MDCLSLADLFLVGLTLDVAGAVLLARGGLISLARMNELSETLFGGGMAPAAEEGHLENRVDAEIGLFYLGLGFGLQVIGYLLDIAGVHSGAGTGRLIVALALVLGSLTFAWLGRSYMRPRLLRRQANRER
jgi:hypothetical protein